MTDSNPLLLQNPIEKIADVQPQHVEPALTAIIADNKAEIARLVEQPLEQISWSSFMLPLEKLEDRLSKAWSPVCHLNSVCNSENLRIAYDKALALLTDYSTELGQNKALYEATAALYQDGNNAELTKVQNHILKDTLIDFKLSGLHLDEKGQKAYASIQSRLAELTSKFEQNLLDATMSWTKSISDEQSLAGLPDTELGLLKANAKAKAKAKNDTKAKQVDGYLITLEAPSFIAVMTYAEDRELRQQVYQAYTTRASELGTDNAKYDNGPIMAELLALKNQKAKLLGYANYAALSIETKMAESPQQVLEFLEKLNQASHAQAKGEFAELQAFAKAQGVDQLQAWDVAYYSEKLKQQSFQISQSELRPYFPANKVIEGLFALSGHHFDLQFKQVANSNVWHSDVIHYQILRDDQPIAEFYLDLYARAHKRGGAWMSDYCGRFEIDSTFTQKPIAYLTCNFAPGVDGQPALLTHDEVVTLFHEFGHGIHHMLTQVNELSASGIANVPWDAVELPSQFMENFCYEPQVIATLSGHFETGEPLPKNLLDKLIAAKNFQSAMAMVRQLEFALFDMQMYLSEPLDVDGIQQTLNDIRNRVAVIQAPEFNRFQHGFSHIFAGGYAAGYYSYKWAEILSADAYSLFEEQGVMDPDAGKQFLTHILEKGGSAEPMELFINFRGREPQIDALLRHSGIQTNDSGIQSNDIKVQSNDNKAAADSD